MDLVNAIHLVVTDTREGDKNPAMTAKAAIEFVRTDTTVRDAYMAWNRPQDRDMRDAYEAVLVAKQPKIDAAIAEAIKRFPALAA